MKTVKFVDGQNTELDDEVEDRWQVQGSRQQ
jgi:hypothetical protein